jgi:hypothetical protein
MESSLAKVSDIIDPMVRTQRSYRAMILGRLATGKTLLARYIMSRVPVDSSHSEIVYLNHANDFAEFRRQLQVPQTSRCLLVLDDADQFDHVYDILIVSKHYNLDVLLVYQSPPSPRIRGSVDYVFAFPNMSDTLRMRTFIQSHMSASTYEDLCRQVPIHSERCIVKMMLGLEDETCVYEIDKTAYDAAAMTRLLYRQNVVRRLNSCR